MITLQELICVTGQEAKVKVVFYIIEAPHGSVRLDKMMPMLDAYHALLVRHVSTALTGVIWEAACLHPA
jgi:hypothetical protein